MRTLSNPTHPPLRPWDALVLILALLACGRRAERPPEPAFKGDLIKVDQPLPDQVVTSPLAIQGEARGTWFFEASFPVFLLNQTGDTLAITPAQAQGEWMTENYVPFKAVLEYATPSSATGTLVLMKDNPSGLPEHANELRIPVRFR